MGQTDSPRAAIRSWDLGGIRFCPSLRELVVDERAHRLPPKPAAVLGLLLEAAPEPVSKSDLLDAAWPHQAVGDSAVADAVKYLRRVVSRAPDEFIQTLHKHGYRLIPVPRELECAPKSRAWPRCLLWVAPVAALAIGALVLAGAPAPGAGSANQVTTPAISQAGLYYVRGVQHYHRYRPEDNRIAIEMFERVLELKPDYVRAWSGLGNAYAMQAHKFGGSRQWIERASEFSRQAIALDPQDPSGYKALGVALSYDGRLEEAARYYEKALAIYPGYAAARVNLAGVRVLQGRADQAIPLLEGALRDAPGGVITRLQMGHAYRALGLDHLADAWYEKGMSLAPGSPADASAWMPVLLARGDFDRARAMLDRMAPGFADNPHLRYWVAMTAFFEGRLDEAVGDFDRAADRADPANAFWVDARLRGVLAEHLLGRSADDAILDSLQTRVLSRLRLGSESWEEPLRLALIAACRDQRIVARDRLDEAFRRGWLYLEELESDPAFSVLRRADRDALSERIVARRQELIAAMQFPPAAVASTRP